MSEKEENAEELETEIEDAVKSNKKIIEIKHSGIVDAEEFKKLKEERDNLKFVVALQAEKEFRAEKESVVSQYPESKQDEIEDLIGDDPSILEQCKRDLVLRGSQSVVRRKAPSGKAVLRQNQENIPEVQGDEFKQYVDDLYKKAKLSTNPEERVNAERQIEQLFESYERGMQENPNAPFKTVTTQCLQCGAILSGRNAELYASRKIPCPYCNYAGGSKGVRNPKGLQSW